jgi:hypothetical protein
MAALKPPFRAKDMQDLYKKVQKGQFDRIPSRYSNDLFSVISSCLQVSASARPNCDQLLSNPKVQRYVQNMDILIEPEKDIKEARRQLLETIKLPKNLKLLKEKLPKSNYNPTTQPKAKEMESLYEKPAPVKEIITEVKGEVVSSRGQRIQSAGVRRSDSQHAINKVSQPETPSQQSKAQQNNVPSYNYANAQVKKPPIQNDIYNQKPSILSPSNANYNNNRYGAKPPIVQNNVHNTPQTNSNPKRPPSNYVQRSYDQQQYAPGPLEKRPNKPASANLHQKLVAKEQILLSNDLGPSSAKRNLNIDSGVSNNKYDAGPKVGTPSGSSDVMAKINSANPQRDQLLQQYSQLGAAKNNIPKATDHTSNKVNNLYANNNYSPSNQISGMSPSGKGGPPRSSSKDLGKQNNMAAGQNLSNNQVSKPSWWG